MMEIEPCYVFGGSEGVQPLEQNLPCSFQLGGKDFTSQAAVVFDANGDADIRTEVSLTLEDSLSALCSVTGTDHITLNGQKVPAFISAMDSSSSGERVITFTPNQEPFPIIGDDETRLSKVVFHLFNFKDRFGTSRKVIHSGNSAYALGITELVSFKWKVELHEIKDADKAEAGKKNTPVLTHVCSLTRTDDSEFNGASARRMMLDLREFFTFSQGHFCPPIMPVGYDENENKAWVLGTSCHPPIRSSMSWFDPHHSEQLAHLFPNFMSKLEDKQWRDTIHSVIYWYVRSNNTSGSGIDTGIILSQVAIERLAYEYAVNHRKLIEPKGFKDLKASDKYRLLFSSLDIPIAIPSNLPKVQAIAKKFKYLDASHFLTEVRNAIVHPEHKRRDVFSDLYYDAWRLGMWYLELAVLRLCDYKETYANRLPREHWIGQVDEVPWGKAPLPGCSGK